MRCSVCGNLGAYLPEYKSDGFKPKPLCAECDHRAEAELDKVYSVKQGIAWAKMWMEEDK
jgi:hypothetical protein